MTIEEFFGTLQESITAEWRKHLQTDKYSAHMALDDFYKEMPEKVDALIEAYQADNDVVKDYKNVLDEGMDALEYLEALKKLTKEGRELLGSSELESLTDDILGLIDSTIYKLKHLKESMTSLADYLHESIGNSLTESVLDRSPGNFVGDSLGDPVLGYMAEHGIGWLLNGGEMTMELRIKKGMDIPDCLKAAGDETQIKFKFNGKTQNGYYADTSKEIKHGIHFVNVGGTDSWYIARKSSRGNVFEPIVMLTNRNDNTAAVPEIEVKSVKDVEDALKSIR